MVNKVLLNYIQKEFERGVDKEDIHQMLVESGWEENDIKEGENSVYGTPQTPIPPSPPKPPAPPNLPTQERPINIPVLNSIQTPTIPQIKNNSNQLIDNSGLLNALKSYKPTNVSAPSNLPTNKEFTPTIPVNNFPTQNQTLNQNLTQNPNPAPEIKPIEPVFSIQKEPPTIQPSKPKTSRVKIIVAIVIIILLLISGGLAYGYFTGYFLPFSKIGDKTFASIAQAKSVTFDSKTTIDMTNVIQQSSPINMIPGFSDKITLTLSGAFALENSLKNETNLAFESGAFSFGSTVKIVDDTLYFKLSNISDIPLFDLQSYIDQWLSFSLKNEPENVTAIESMENMGMVNTPENTNGENLEIQNTPAENPNIQSPFMVPIGINPSTYSGLNDEQKAEVKNMIGKTKFITITKRFGSEDMDGTMTQHLAFVLNKTEISIFLFDLEKYIHSVAGENINLINFDTSETVKNLDKMKNFKGEVWINKNDNLPLRLDLSFESQEGTDENSVAQINFTSTFKDWNMPIQIDTPVDSRPLNTYIENTMEGFQNRSLDINAMDRLNVVREQAKEFFALSNSSYVDFCKQVNPDPTGIPIDGYPQITCKDGLTNYISYAPLNETPNTYYCVDNINMGTIIDKVPKGFLCK